MAPQSAAREPKRSRLSAHVDGPLSLSIQRIARYEDRSINWILTTFLRQSVDAWAKAHPDVKGVSL